jgi:AbrB family looped-hinge helix DNA binding protein
LQHNIYKAYNISKEMTVIKLSRKGKIIISKSLRNKLGLKAGDRLHVYYENNFIILKKIGGGSIVDDVAGTVDIDPTILERRKLSRFGGRSEKNHS